MNRTTKWGGQRYRSSLRVGVTLAAAAAIALIAGVKPNEARAADGTTDVTVQVAEGDENLAWSVPTQIPMKATAEGTLIGPGADAIAIRNLSAFPIRVKQMDTIAETPFHLVDDVDKSSGSNDFMMTVNGSAAKQSVELPDDGTWAMGYARNEKGSDVLPLTISGAKIARVMLDLSAAKKAATVTWTVEPTNYVKPEPKPNPNGVAFAVYSADDKSFDFYKRDRKPEIGDTFNKKTVSQIYDVDEVGDNRSWGYGTSAEAIRANTLSVEVIDSGLKPKTIEYWFYYFTELTDANLIKLDTSDVESMYGTFDTCYRLAHLDLSTWNTSKVKSMYRTFGCDHHCTMGIESIDGIADWDMSSVTDMGEMFDGCSKLAVNCSNWNVTNVSRHDGFNNNALGVIAPNWRN